MQSINGNTVVITGASAGIGRATAHAIAEEGANVVLAARRLGRLEDIAMTLQREHGISATPVSTNVTDRDQVDELIETAVNEHGTLDALVNNAGLVFEGEVETMEDKEYHKMMDVNTDGMFYTSRAALPYLKETDGTVVFVASFAGQYPRSSNPVYAATKWWTRGFAHSLQGQVGDDGVAVSVISPSEVRTEFGAGRGKQSKEKYEEGDVTDPESIGAAIRFMLCQEDIDTVSEMNLYRRDKFETF